jgi:two-component system chemotaxis response regulator CheB
MGFGVVAVGASWGGLHAVGVLLAGLADDFTPAVVVAQHRGPDGPHHLADALANRGKLPVTEATDKEILEGGHVYIAPANYHLLVDRGGLALSTDEPENFSRPSIDVLFESVADAYGHEAIGVILTGASEDGAAGLARIRTAGGITIVQEPKTAARSRMPEAAIAGGGAQKILVLDDIAPFLNEIAWSQASRGR